MKLKRVENSCQNVNSATAPNSSSATTSQSTSQRRLERPRPSPAIRQQRRSEQPGGDRERECRQIEPQAAREEPRRVLPAGERRSRRQPQHDAQQRPHHQGDRRRDERQRKRAVSTPRWRVHRGFRCRKECATAVAVRDSRQDHHYRRRHLLPGARAAAPMWA